MGRQSNLFKKRLREQAEVSDKKIKSSDSTKRDQPVVGGDNNSLSSSQINLDRLDTNVSTLIKSILEADQVSLFY